MAVVGEASEKKTTSVETHKVTSPVLNNDGAGDGTDGSGSVGDSIGSLEQHGAASRSPNGSSSHPDVLTSALHGFASIAASALSQQQQTRSSVSLDEHHHHSASDTVTATTSNYKHQAPSNGDASQVSPSLGAVSASTDGIGIDVGDSKPAPARTAHSTMSPTAVAVTPAVSGDTPKKGPLAATASPSEHMASATAVPKQPGLSETNVTTSAGGTESTSMEVFDVGSGTDSTSSPQLSASKRGVPHVYRDYVNIPDAVGMVRKKTGGVTQPFPEKLHEMLDTIDDPSIVCWLPHGRAFIVRDPRLFTQVIMPKYFRQTKLTSFQRQLNLYGFRRLTQGADSGAYYHELFLRGRPLLSLRMQRQKVKGTGHKQPADVKTEPNFYAMPPSVKPHNSPTSETSQLEQPNLTGLRQPGNSSDAHGHSIPTNNLLESSSGAARPHDVARSLTRTGVVHDLSPGLQGLHSAANLLKGLAAGLPASSLESPFSLGQSAHKGSSASASPTASNGFLSPSRTIVAGSPDSTARAYSRPSFSSITAQYLLPKERSNSLLGRVTHIDEKALNGSVGSPPSQSTSAPPRSAFFWPPSQQPDTSSSKFGPSTTSEVCVERLQSKEAVKAVGPLSSESGGEQESTSFPSTKPNQTPHVAVLKTGAEGMATSLPCSNLAILAEKTMSQEEAFVEKKVSKKGLETEEV